MDKKIILTIGISIILSVILSFFLFNSMGGMKKQAYVDMITVFNEFELKIKLQKKMEDILKEKRLVIDNLKLELQAVYNDSEIIGNERFVKVREIQNEIELKSYEASQEEQKLTDQFDTQIWKQLNQYIKEFGKNQELDFMYGANGQGTILFAKEKYDLTKECISYVNNKYQGIE